MKGAGGHIEEGHVLLLLIPIKTEHQRMAEHVTAGMDRIACNAFCHNLKPLEGHM
jgi:hypothetical protein